MWSFSRDGLVGMQVGRKEGKPPFSHLCISSLILSSFSGAVRKLICPPGVQTHLSGRQNLFLLWGPMSALVCRSLPHARGGSPRQLPHLPSKALVEIPVPHCRLYPPPPSLFPPSPPPPLQNTPTCRQPGQQRGAASKLPSQGTPKENFPPRRECGILPDDVTLHHPLHCTVM